MKGCDQNGPYRSCCIPFPLLQVIGKNYAAMWGLKENHQVELLQPVATSVQDSGIAVYLENYGWVRSVIAAVIARSLPLICTEWWRYYRSATSESTCLITGKLSPSSATGTSELAQDRGMIVIREIIGPSLWALLVSVLI